MFGVSLSPSETESLETIRAIHSFVERSAILLFAGVVSCDTILHFVGDRHPWDTTVKWSKRKLAFRLGDKLYGATLPGYSGRCSPKAIVKMLSLVWFAAAIFLELIALPYSERTDKLADDELAFSVEQTRTALIQASRATLLAGNISDRADKLADLLNTEQETTARFQKQATESQMRLEQTEAHLEETQARAETVIAELDLQARKRSPRATLLHDSYMSDDLRLRPFRGQHTVLVVCLPLPQDAYPELYADPHRAQMAVIEALMGANDPVSLERADTLRELGRQLTAAHWSTNIAITPCGGPVGASVVVDIAPVANVRTQLAAEQLANVLHDALLLDSGVPSVSVFAEQLPEYTRYDPEHSIEIIVYNNPRQ